MPFVPSISHYLSHYLMLKVFFSAGKHNNHIYLCLSNSILIEKFKRAILTSICGTFKNTKDSEYKTLETAAAVIMLFVRRLLSLLGTNAVFNVFVRSKSL
jgi:hypothetical protein